MVMVVIGILVVIFHVTVLGTIILWFGLGYPTSIEQFRTRFKTQFLGGGKRSK
jgi:hypothetical protein